MVPGEDGPGQVVESAATGGACVALAVGLSPILVVLDHLSGRAMGAGNPLGPEELTDRLEALGVFDEDGEMDHDGGHSESVCGTEKNIGIGGTHRSNCRGWGRLGPSPRNPA